jgi:hypothetical protein
VFVPGRSIQPGLTIVRRPFKMRSTFSKCVYSMMTLKCMIHLLYGTERSGERTRQSEGEKERENREEWEVECGRERVAAWIINLTVGQVYMMAQRRDNTRVYQDGNKAYHKNFWWSISLSATTFHPSDKLMIYHIMFEGKDKSLPKSRAPWEVLFSGRFWHYPQT